MLTLEELTAIEPHVLRSARLIAFTSGVIVPRPMLGALGHGAYNFHPGPPDYPAGRRRISPFMTARGPSARPLT